MVEYFKVSNFRRYFLNNQKIIDMTKLIKIIEVIGK
jgi:hypothetical protein